MNSSVLFSTLHKIPKVCRKLPKMVFETEITKSAIKLVVKGSVGTQLFDSIGQTNRVLLNMTTDYNARLLSSAPRFNRFFRKKYEK